MCPAFKTAMMPARLAMGGVLLMLALPVLSASTEQLGAGDTIRVTVFQNPDLETEARLSSGGTLLFPLVGEIELAGQTPIEAAGVIADRLKRGRFIVDPQVSVSLVEVRSRRVSVLGHVARPGQYALDGANTTLTDILALAGGVTETGAPTVVVIAQRAGELQRLEIDVPGMYESGDLSGDIELENDDTIFVPATPVFYIYGAVQRAGAYPLAPDTSVITALSLGGGLTPQGSERGIKIHRRVTGGPMRELDASLTDSVEENDVIYVKEGLF